MKRISSIVAVIVLAGLVPCRAQDNANPFVRNTAGHETGPTGASFSSFMEQILVDPDDLDRWLEEHPLKEDATELREVARQWTAQGKATLDHVAMIRGVAGRAAEANATVEQMYPCEYQPSTPGAWPMPHSINTRNIGDTLETGMSDTPAGLAPWCVIEQVSLAIPGKAWHALTEETRQPEDIILPRFRSHRIGVALLKGDGDLPSGDKDPFAEPAPDNTEKDPKAARGMLFRPGITQLAGRIDSSDGNPGKTRLFFFRGAVEAPPAGNSMVQATDISRLRFLAVKVASADFAAWMAKEKRGDLWTTTTEWTKSGRASRFVEFSGQVRPGTQTTWESIDEYIYPTSWFRSSQSSPDPSGKTAPAQQDKATLSKGIAAGSIPSAFDTRNIGTSIEAKIVDDPKGALLSFSWDHIKPGGMSVFRRIEVDGEWIPDVTAPLFVCRRVASTVRLQRDQWMLLGEVPAVRNDGQADREHCLLVFARAE